MLVCIYRTLTTIKYGDDDFSLFFSALPIMLDTSPTYYYNNINIILMYPISRYVYSFSDRRQMILDLLICIRSYIDRTLAFRSSCCEGVCGSCAMMINSTTTLACIQPIWLINSYVIIYPLPHFNVIKDLIIDLKHFYEQYIYVNPFYSVFDLDGYADIYYSQYNLYILYIVSLMSCNVYSYPFMSIFKLFKDFLYISGLSLLNVSMVLYMVSVTRIYIEHSLYNILYKHLYY